MDRTTLNRSRRARDKARKAARRNRRAEKRAEINFFGGIL